MMPAPRRTLMRNEIQLPENYSIHLRKPIVLESLAHYSFDLYGKPFRAEHDINLFAMLDGLGSFSII
jgi:hypothetical protein